MKYYITLFLSLLFFSCQKQSQTDLSEQSLNNLIAFAKLYGYVRFFHPSDEAQKIDWALFAIYGVREVENAKNNDELKSILQKIFFPIAPTLRIYKTGDGTDIKPYIPSDTAKLSVVIWKHFGLGGLNNEGSNIYKSIRGTNAKDTSEMFKTVEKFPQANEFYTSEIGGGLVISMPLALYKDSIGTLPHSDSVKLNNFLNEVANSVPKEITANVREVRLADIVISWNIFRHFYPYLDVIKTDWNSELAPALKEAAKNKTECEFQNTLRKFLAKLEDGHIFLTHKCDLHYSYFPPFNWEWLDNNLVITKVFDKAKDQLKPGDIVVEVNGIPASDALQYEEEYVSGATLQWKRNRDKRLAFRSSLMGLLSDFNGSNIELAVKRGDKLLMTDIRRTLTNVDVLPEQPKIEGKSPGIFYIDLTRINDDDFNNALPQLANAKGIVFDMRGYPKSVTPVFLQHLIKTNVTSAKWMIPIYLFPDQKDVVYSTSGRWDLAPLLPYLNAKIAFITDGRAISYAESIMGVVEYYKLGEIIGEPTAGTNGNVNELSLPGGYHTYWTGMKVLKHDGSQHHGVGIQPTIPVSKTIKGVIEGRDEQLEKAIEVVSK